MRQKFLDAIAGLPRQFWIIVGGLFINSIGGSMIMPFFTLYVSRRFSLPMTGVGMLFVTFTVVGIFCSWGLVGLL